MAALRSPKPQMKVRVLLFLPGRFGVTGNTKDFDSFIPGSNPGIFTKRLAQYSNWQRKWT